MEWTGVARCRHELTGLREKAERIRSLVEICSENCYTARSHFAERLSIDVPRLSLTVCSTTPVRDFIILQIAGGARPGSTPGSRAGANPRTRGSSVMAKASERRVRGRLVRATQASRGH